MLNKEISKCTCEFELLYSLFWHLMLQAIGQQLEVQVWVKSVDCTSSRLLNTLYIIS